VPVRPTSRYRSGAERGRLRGPIPPHYVGGNIDDWRIGKAPRCTTCCGTGGAPVRRIPRLAGGLRALWNRHRVLAHGTFQLVLHKRTADADGRGRSTGSALAGLDYPLPRDQDEWVLHGFSFRVPDRLGPDAQKDIYAKTSVTSRCADRVPQGAALPDDTVGSTRTRRSPAVGRVDFGYPVCGRQLGSAPISRASSRARSYLDEPARAERGEGAEELLAVIGRADFHAVVVEDGARPCRRPSPSRVAAMLCRRIDLGQCPWRRLTMPGGTRSLISTHASTHRDRLKTRGRPRRGGRAAPRRRRAAARAAAGLCAWRGVRNSVFRK